MRTFLCILVMFLFVSGCSQQTSDQLTQEQISHIKTEVKAVVDSVIANFIRLDAEGTLRHYSPKALAVGDTSLLDYQAFKTAYIEFNKTVSDIQWTQRQATEIVLRKDIAMTNLVGKLVVTFKSKDKMTIDPQFYSDVYVKTDGQWKIVYEHGSGIPVMEKAAKK
jgi:hypothetical protein